jgi:hypothetical protein
MAKNKIILDVKVDDKGGTKKLGVESKKTAKNLDKMGTSARTADRNIKGAAQASSGAGKNFSKMAQGAGGLVGVYATLAASAFAVSAAFNFLKGAMDFKNLLEGQKALGAVTGVAYKTITNSVVEATNGQLKYAEAAKAAAIGSASGISPDQLNRLGAAAKNASLALGRDLGDSFDRLIRGVTKAEPELLDELGIILRLENATRKYGQEIGKSKDELNEFERSQAVANEVLSQAERKFGAMEKMMDPTAHSLNQFAKAFDDLLNKIKTGVADVIGPLASFLANNMMALTGAVALFAGGLLKQVLPSMSAWKESSQATAKQVGRDQQAVQLRLARTQKSYEKLKLARMNDASIAKKAGAKIAAEVPGGTKSGQGGLDFLKGNTDSKRSQRAADKALLNAENQLKKSAKKRTGLLKNMNAQQVADLRKSYNIRAGIHKKGMADFAFQLKKGGLAIKSFKLQLTSMASTAKVAFAGLAGAAATAGAVIGKAFFWISMLSIAYDGMKMIKEYFYPMSEETKKLEKRTEELTSKYKTLGEELGRTVDVMKDYTMLNGSDMIQTRGKAVGSLGLTSMIKEINEAIEMYPDRMIPDEMFERMIKTADAAGELDEGFKVLSASLNSGTKITDEQRLSMVNLGNDLQNVGITLDRLPSKIAAMNTQLTKLTGTIKKPFASELQSSLTAVIDSQTVALAARGTELGKEAAQLEEFEKKHNIDRDGKGLKIGQVESDLPTLSGQPQMVDVFAKPSQEILDIHARSVEQLNLQNSALGDLSKRLETNKFFTEALKENQDEMTRLSNEQVTAQTEAAAMRTNGITIEDKIKNVQAQGLILSKSANDEQQALLLLRSQEVSLTDENGKARENLLDTEITTLEQVRAQIIEGEKKLQQANREIELGEENNSIKIVELNQQKVINEQIRKRLALTTAIFRTSLALKNIQAGGTGLFGQARGQAADKAFETNLNAKRSQAEQDVLDTQKIVDAEKAKEGTPGYDPMNAFNAQKANQGATNRLASLNQEIELYKKREELVLLNAKGETEALQLKVQSISMNPAMTAFNVQMNELKSQGVELTIAEQGLLYEEIKTQTMLAKLAENKQALFDGIASSMSAAFTSIVTGTASAKEAFKSMAISILSQITQMIAQMMIMRVLMSAFGMGAPTDAGMTDFSSGYNVAAIARTGGVFSEGKKTQGYATGGVARGSTSGYPATLHGTEAVVPLPNGRSIPVDMKDSGATNNNIVVNISTDGQSSKEGSSGPDMDKLGAAVASAVQTELHNQKRSGGILNPYGVA